VVPLPPALLGFLSPGTHRLYVENLPGYASTEGSADLQSWLLHRRDTLSKDLAPRTKNQTGFEGKMMVPARWKPISWYPGKTLERISRFLAYWALFLLVVDFMPDRAIRRRLPWMLVLLGFGIAFLGILQHLTWNGKIYWFIKVYQGHPFGPWVNSNHFSGYLELILPLGGALVLRAGGRMRPTRRRRSRRSAVPKLLLGLFSLACICAAMVAARSRGGLFSLAFIGVSYAAAQVVAGAWKNRHPRLAAVLVAVPLLLVTAGAAAYVFRSGLHDTSLEEGMEPSLASRVVAWKGVAKMVASNPLAGTGLGTFGLAYPVFKTYGSTGSWIQAHNDYLEVLAESGVVGFALLMSGFVALFRRFLLPVLLAPWREQEPVALGAGLGLVVLLLHEIVDFNLQIPANGLLFVLMGALLVRLQAASASSPTEHGEGEENPGMAGNP
jgi:O-antigen ligase